MVILDVDITELQAQIGLKVGALVNLRSLAQEKTIELATHEQEFESLRNQLGWREKSVAGLLGGNKTLAQKFKRLSLAISSGQEIIDRLNTDIEKGDAEINGIIVTWLNKNSKIFRRVSIELNNHVELYNRSKSFYNFLIEAKEEIDNALMFVSWDGLLNHPQAKKGIALFSSETVKYQQLISAYETAMQVSLMGGRQLESLIRFTSEAVALESFNKIKTIVTKNVRYAEEKFKESSIVKESTIIQVKELLN